jgi:N-acetyl-anhydromuramyl-L-alanine amidase AmpD
VGSDVKTLKKKGYGYHFLIGQDGSIVQGAPTKKKLSHAGNSYGPNGKYLNGNSIGVSFSMLGDEKKQVGSSVFNEDQLSACVDLLLDLKEAIPSLKYITGHHWVSPGRKVDPYTLPFDELLVRPKLQYDSQLFNYFTTPDTLKSVGYELWKTGYAPFPSGLDDCKCISTDSNGNCTKSQGDCYGPGGYRYSERALSTTVSELSFGSDMDTE